MRGVETRKLGKRNKGAVVVSRGGVGVIDKNLERENRGLLPKWLKFIDEYMENGFNGMKAYAKVYGCTDDAARSSASKLLSYASVNQEIQYRIESQRITENAIVGELWDIGKNYRKANTIGAAVSALQTLAKTKGMLIDTKKIHFDQANPAVFLGVYSKEEKEEIEQTGGRITE